jgi:hypothetical protein
VSELEDTCASLLAALQDAAELRARLGAHGQELQRAAAAAATVGRDGSSARAVAEVAQALDLASARCKVAAALIAEAEASAKRFVQRTVKGSYGSQASVGADALAWAGASTGSPDGHTEVRIPQGSGLEVSRTQSGGYNLLPPDDAAGRAGSCVAGIHGYTDIVVHGNPWTFGTLSGPDVSGGELGDLIRSLPGYDGSPIRLLACQAGMLDDGAAQHVADRLGVRVLAPTHTVHLEQVDGSVEMVVGPNLWSPVERPWRVFEPRGT